MLKASVIVPTLNEVGAIKQVLDAIPKESADEILVIDGHSTDGTVELVKKLGYPLFFEEGRGFGAAFSTGIKKAKNDIVVFLASDNSQDPADIPNLLDKLQEGYDMVMASRYLPGGGSDDDTFLHFAGNKFFTFLVNKLHGADFSDVLYFFLAARKKVFDEIKPVSEGFGYCIELPVKAHKAGFKITQVPSFERRRSSGKVKAHTFTAGFKILLEILRLK